MGPVDPVPESVDLEILYRAVLDTLDLDYRESTRAEFRAIARGRPSTEYQFLTCFADYTATNLLLGSGATPTVATGKS